MTWAWQLIKLNSWNKNHCLNGDTSSSTGDKWTFLFLFSEGGNTNFYHLEVYLPLHQRNCWPNCQKFSEKYDPTPHQNKFEILLNSSSFHAGDVTYVCVLYILDLNMQILTKLTLDTNLAPQSHLSRTPASDYSGYTNCIKLFLTRIWWN